MARTGELYGSFTSISIRTRVLVSCDMFCFVVESYDICMCLTSLLHALTHLFMLQTYEEVVAREAAQSQIEPSDVSEEAALREAASPAQVCPARERKHIDFNCVCKTISTAMRYQRTPLAIVRHIHLHRSMH